MAALPDLWSDPRFQSMQPEMLPPQNFGTTPGGAATGSYGARSPAEVAAQAKILNDAQIARELSAARAAQAGVQGAATGVAEVAPGFGARAAGLGMSALRGLWGLRNFGAGAVVSAQAGSALNAAQNSTIPATYENRPERALQILGGADLTGLGARIGRVATGGDWSSPDDGITGPATRSFLDKTGGALPVTTPTLPTLPATQSGSIGKEPDANITYSDQARAAMASAQGAVPKPAEKPFVDNFAPGFAGIVQAIGNLKQIGNAQANARTDTAQKLKAEQIGAEVAKNQAEAANAGLRAEAAARMRTLGKSEEEIAAATMGRAPADSVMGFPSLTPGGPIDVLKTRGPGAGGAVRVVPKPQATEKDIVAGAAKLKKPGMSDADARKLAIETARRNNIDVSAIRP